RIRPRQLRQPSRLAVSLPVRTLKRPVCASLPYTPALNRQPEFYLISAPVRNNSSISVFSMKKITRFFLVSIFLGGIALCAGANAQTSPRLGFVDFDVIMQK